MRILPDQLLIVFGAAPLPFNENRCRDRFAAMIEPELGRFGVLRITEADMPRSKRADLALAKGAMHQPMEVKGQWIDDVWDAATGQLDRQYLIDWRSEGRGIYLVLWFGTVRADSGRRLKVHPDAHPAPADKEEMRRIIIDRIPASRRDRIDVVVLDLCSGRK